MFLVFLVFLQFNSLFLYYSDTFIFTINSVFLIPNLLNMEVFQVFHYYSKYSTIYLHSAILNRQIFRSL